MADAKDGQSLLFHLGVGVFQEGGNLLNFLFCQSKITIKDFIVSIVDTVYMIYRYIMCSLFNNYTQILKHSKYRWSTGVIQVCKID